MQLLLSSDYKDISITKHEFCKILLVVDFLNSFFILNIKKLIVLGQHDKSGSENKWGDYETTQSNIKAQDQCRS